MALKSASLVIGVVVVGLAGPLAGQAGQDLPDADTVVKRVVERADNLARNGRSEKYLYEKRSVVEELDAAGKVSESTEKLYQVILIEGVPFSRLVKIQNRDLTEAELKAEQRKEEAFRKKVTGKESGEKVKHRLGEEIGELVGHYDFKVERRENLGNRPALVLSFRPKADRKLEKAIVDKVLNRLAGTIWVDEEESEVARLKVGLTEGISLGWFGMVGSLKQCDLSLENQRVADGVWLKAKQTILIAGRKVVSAMRYRATEEEYGFRKP